MIWYRVGRRNQLARVEQDPKDKRYVATVVGSRPGERGDTIEEAVDNATGVGR